MAEAKKKKSTKVVGRRAMKAADFAALSTGGELPMDENAKMRKEIEELEEKCREERRTALLHYEAAFSALDPREKESLLQNAQLREELSLQRTGLDAVGRRVAEERVELAELLGDVRRLKDEESARAVAAAKLRHARDAAKSLAKRLAASLEALQAAREESVARSLDVLPEFSEETVRGFRDKEDDESTVASAQSAAELPKPTRSSERLSLAGLDNAPLPGGFKPSPGDEAKLSREEEAAVDYARKSLDAHDDTFPDVTLDSRLFKATIRAWEDQDGDLARLAPVDPDSPFDTIGAIAASDGKPAASHARATGGRDEKRRAAPAPSAAPPRRRFYG
ncbi:hypothetical protein JL722_2844 [Aureococcus anophagefferens]|nr:hypothetical protein JL722_2844 [Aureococcus anophagefferens]